MNLIIASWNFTQAPSLAAAANQFIADRSLVWNWIFTNWDLFASWIAQPNVLAIILAWSITFTIVVTLLLIFAGFGAGGIAAGSLAAGFQSWMYGGFTPAAGIFATLTSFGMLGYAVPGYAAVSAVIATFVAALVWACGVGT